MGIHSHLHIGSTRPKINNPKAVRKILKGYASRLPLDIVVEGKNRLLTVVRHHENEPVDWPSAIEAVDVLSEDAFNDMELYYETVDRMYETRGGEGLTDMLLKLAPYLDAPLIVQAASFSTFGKFGRAKEWTVRPGATEVEIKEILGMDEEHSIVFSF